MLSSYTFWAYPDRFAVYPGLCDNKVYLIIQRGVDNCENYDYRHRRRRGYIASVLCANYDDVTLIARRKRKESLQTKGLVVHSDFFGDHTAHPAVTDDPASAGIQDVIFVCVKNYSLEAALTAVLPCIGDDTIVVPVLNGFTYHDTAAALMKRGKIVDSAIYITSSYKEDYSIRQEGRFARIYIGSDDADATKKIYGILNHPGLTCCIAENITVEIWRKFILNCAYNVLTAYYRTSIGGALSQPHGREEFRALLQEAYDVGKAAGVPCPTTSSTTSTTAS